MASTNELNGVASLNGYPWSCPRIDEQGTDGDILVVVTCFELTSFALNWTSTKLFPFLKPIVGTPELCASGVGVFPAV